MNSVQFAGFFWPKKEWALPTGKPSDRVRKTVYTSGYYENEPRRSEEHKEIGFYQNEGGCSSGRQFDLRMKVSRDGWYADSSFWDAAWHACIMALPHGRGWLAGATMGSQMCAHVSRYIHDCEAEAWIEASSMAEEAAKESREADAKDQAQLQIQEMHEEIAQARATLKRVLGARKRMEMAAPEVCGDLASYVSDRMQEIRKARERITLLEREPWQAVAW